MLNIKSISSEPRILLWDIETGKGYAKVPFYQLKQYSNYINPDYVERHVWMVCVAWKWLGSDFVGSTSVLKDKYRFEACFYDDYHVVKIMHSIIEDADILIAHNGDAFDWKVFNARCAFHGLDPPKTPVMIDTLKISRKRFKLESHALKYLARYLSITDKGDSPDWDKIYNGDPDEIRRCEEYNRQDVRVLEELYKKIRPYATNHPNLNVFYSGVHHPVCSKCGHHDLQKRGFSYTKSGKFQKYQCSKRTGGCGGWSHHKKSLKNVNIK